MKQIKNEAQQKPIVSVVIITNQRKPWMIKRCLDSVYQQSFTEYEIILVDDNEENDEYRNAIKREISFEGIRYIEHTKNQGAQKSRNDGIDAAQGEFIAFLDDDDEWYPDKLSVQVALFKQDDIGLVYCNGDQITTKDQEVIKTEAYRRSAIYQEEYSFTDLAFSDYIGATSQVMVRTSILRECGGFDLNQPARQDYEMWLRISKVSRCVGTDQKLFIYYIHNEEQISKDTKKVIRGYQNIYHKHKTDFKMTAKAHMINIIGNCYASSDKLRRIFLVLYSRFLFVLAFFLDHREFVYRLHVQKKRRKSTYKSMMKRSVKVLGALIIGGVTVITAFWNQPILRKYVVHSEAIENPIRIVQISDLHSAIYGTNQSKLLQKIREQKPDLIMMTGDIFDQYMSSEGAYRLIEGLVEEYPIYYIYGNHEYLKSNVQEIITKIQEMGVIVLDDEVETLTIKGNLLTIAGIGDPYKNRKLPPELVLQEALEHLPLTKDDSQDSSYQILLAHRPEFVALYKEYPFDLILSGHSHGGQIRLPFLLNGLYTPGEGLFPKYAGGRYTIEQATMIVSRGLPKVQRIPRIFNPPEIVIIDLKN